MNKERWGDASSIPIKGGLDKKDKLRANYII